MTKLAEYQLKKAKMRMDAANTKPEKPRIEQQLGLQKSLLNMQKEINSDDKRIDSQMYGELDQKWKGNKGGSSGDALISGLKAGLQKGSFMEDKERYKKVMKFTEDMEKMVSEQNTQLFEEERLFNAKKSVEPRIMAYLNSYKNMSPNDRKVYLQNTMDEYNQKAGTDYKIVDATGSEPWKIIISDGQELAPLDFMDFIKMPEEKRVDYYLNSNESKNYENQLAKEDNLDNLNKNASLSYQQSKARDSDMKYKEHEEALQVEKEILEKNGDNVKFIDNMSTSGKNHAERHIKEYTEKANLDLAAEKRLERAVKIAEDHPELFGNLNAIIASRYNENPGYLNNILKNKIPEESRDAMSELAGIVKSIFTDSVKGITAKGVNQFIEKKLEAGSPNQRWTPEAFKKVVNEARKEYSKDYDEHKKVADYGSSGLYYRPRAKSREDKKVVSKENTEELDNKLKSIPGLTAADIDEAERRLRNGS